MLIVLPTLCHHGNPQITLQAVDMNVVYQKLPDRDRIERIEMFDEIELLTQLLHHYCLATAAQGTLSKVHKYYTFSGFKLSQNNVTTTIYTTLPPSDG